MPEADWLDREPLLSLVAELTGDIASRYRISWSDAEQMVHEHFAPLAVLQQAAAKAATPARLKRTRVFKQAATEAKRKIYYHLRSYRVDDHSYDVLLNELREIEPNASHSQRGPIIDGILNGHASTRERLAEREEFYQQLAAHVPPPRAVLDVGCGVQPLMFPFDRDWASHLDLYVALDSDAQDVECVDAFSRFEHGRYRLAAARWNIADGWRHVTQLAECEQFNLALLMKIVPVVDRQHRDLLPILYETPAEAWLVTGSRRSLTKNVSIEAREKRVLESFVRASGRSIQHEFAIAEEFAWLVV